MLENVSVAKAQLIPLDASGNEQDDNRTTVQFNPETLKVSFANQVAQSGGSGEQRSQGGLQFVGRGTTKLSVQLWFDVTGEGADGASDVRDLTRKVAYFITPQPAPEDDTKRVPPLTRLVWGSFQFDGVVDSMEESLEFFSPEGRPLRASVTLQMSQQTISDLRRTSGGPDDLAEDGVGTTPAVEAPPDSSVQELAARNGLQHRWRELAEAHGIEDALRVPAGVRFDLSVLSRSSR